MTERNLFILIIVFLFILPFSYINKVEAQNIDARVIIGLCGDGTINTGESCDGTNFGGASCSTQGYAGGTLSCTPACELSTTSCTLTPDPTPIPAPISTPTPTVTTVPVYSSSTGGGGGSIYSQSTLPPEWAIIKKILLTIQELQNTQNEPTPIVEQFTSNELTPIDSTIETPTPANNDADESVKIETSYSPSPEPTSAIAQESNQTSEFVWIKGAIVFITTLISFFTSLFNF